MSYKLYLLFLYRATYQRMKTCETTPQRKTKSAEYLNKALIQNTKNSNSALKRKLKWSDVSCKLMPLDRSTALRL